MAAKDGQTMLNPESTPREINIEIDEQDRMVESPPQTPERRFVPKGYYPPWFMVATKKLKKRTKITKQKRREQISTKKEDEN
jgi:hypothetical protein